jgi:hypothetical protein
VLQTVLNNQSFRVLLGGHVGARWAAHPPPTLAEDDEVLDYRPILATAGAARVLVLPRGGHPLHNTGDYAAVIDEFLAECP